MKICMCMGIKGNQSKDIPPYVFVKVEVRGWES